MGSTDELQDVNISYRVWIGTIVTIVPATVAVILRFIARFVSHVGYWWDDYTILVSLFVNWAMAAMRWVQIIHFGLGRHAQFLPEETLQNFNKTFIAIQALYFTNAVFTKLSLLLLYHRVFGVILRFRWVLWISGFLVVGYFIACLIVSIAGCSPVSRYWNPHQPGSCIDEVNFYRWNGICNMLLDFLILCLPFPLLWRVNMSVRQKLVLSGIFLLGGFVCVVSIIRIISFNKQNRHDTTYNTTFSETWSSIEQSVGIICACLPTLRPLFRQLYGSTQIDYERDSAATSAAQTQPTTRSSLGSERNEASGENTYADSDKDSVTRGRSRSTREDSIA